MLAERDYQLASRANSKVRARRVHPAHERRRPEIAAARPWTHSASDIAQLEAQLATAIEERTKLQREIGTMKRDAWAAERIAAELPLAHRDAGGSGLRRSNPCWSEHRASAAGAAAATSRDDASAENDKRAERLALADRICAPQLTSRVASTNYIVIAVSSGCGYAIQTERWIASCITRRNDERVEPRSTPRSAWTLHLADLDGRLAQRGERSLHRGEVVGSTTAPTSLRSRSE